MVLLFEWHASNEALDNGPELVEILLAPLGPPDIPLKSLGLSSG